MASAMRISTTPASIDATVSSIVLTFGVVSVK